MTNWDLKFGHLLVIGAWPFSCTQISTLLQVLQDRFRCFTRTRLLRLDQNLRLLRRFIRIVNSGEPLDLPGTGLLVQALRVALLRAFQRHVHVHFDEIARLAAGAYQVAILLVWADEARDRNHSRVREELGDLANAAD